MNTILGVLIAAVGVADIVLARVLGDRFGLPPAVRTLLAIAGAGFLLFGAAIALGSIRLVEG
jgi:hypothetical protein